MVIRLTSVVQSPLHPDLFRLVGKDLRVIGEVETKTGPAYLVRDEQGEEFKVLKKYVVSEE